MEQNELKTIQDEMIDSLAKNCGELDKRQSRLEGLKLEEVPGKIAGIETRLQRAEEHKQPDYNAQIHRFGRQLDMLDQKIDAIPPEIPVRTTLQLDTRSKQTIHWGIGLILAVAILLALNVYLWIEVSRAADDRDKYLILRGFYPEVAAHIDTAYASNGTFLVRKAQANINMQQRLSEADFEARQAEEVSRLKKEQLKKLKQERSKEKNR